MWYQCLLPKQGVLMMNTANSPQNRKLEGESMKNIIFESKEDNLHFEGVLDIDARELNDKKEEVCLIDVRQPDEFIGDLGHIPGAKLIVLDTLPDRMNEIPKDQPVVFVCRSGGRSARAAAHAFEQGYKNIYNLKGGMILWNELHFETEA
jgi:hydroxyacylglutathione hydrolase